MGPDIEGHSRQPMHGRSAWLITDGKAGTEAICLGLADRLGLDYKVLRVAPEGLARALAPWGPVPRGEAFGTPASRFQPPWPAVAIASGRTSIPYLRALSRLAGHQTFRIVLQDPHTPAGIADVIWVPEHDQRRGTNVIHTPTPPHRFSPARIAELRKTPPEWLAALPSPRVAMLIGGPSGRWRYDEGTIDRLKADIASVAAKAGSLLVTTSRRTPTELVSAIDLATREKPRHLFRGQGENPYPHYLAFADAFFVTGDSVNMVGEAAVTGRPIHLFMPAGGGAKFVRFHAAIAAAGATRPFDPAVAELPEWAYPPLYSTEKIAEEIEARWARRQDMLPSGR